MFFLVDVAHNSRVNTEKAVMKLFPYKQYNLLSSASNITVTSSIEA